MTGLTTGAITGVIDRLEGAGLAHRQQDPNDRCKVLVRALPAVQAHRAALRTDAARQILGRMEFSEGTGYGVGVGVCVTVAVFVFRSSE
jgi:DNA-binding MarR family transcriptional regulator